MTRLLGWIALMAGWLAAGALAAEKQPAALLPDLDKAVWIWDSPAALSEGTTTCYFRKGLVLSAKPVSATVLVTADNGYDLYVNGSVVGGETGYGSEYWQSVEKYDVGHLLTEGNNGIAIRGTNLGGPAGLIAAIRVDFKDRPPVEVRTDRTWRVQVSEQTGWSHNDYDASKWPAAVEVAPMGSKPWGPVKYGLRPTPSGRGGRPSRGFSEPPEGFRWPEAVIFLSGRVGESSTSLPQLVWRIGGSRAYLEFDRPGPSVLGRRFHVLRPARPDAQPAVLLDAGGGLIGSPSVSYDGGRVYFAMAQAGEKFFHIWSMPAGGGEPRQLTDGPFHDFDPEELPDGRIVFSSTRIGSREEYHGNAARCLFVMDLPAGQAGADGSNIRPITHHIVGDNEPRVTADGLIAFIRCDNFLERAKVETQLHLMHADGTAGVVLMGGDRYAIGYDRPTAAEQNSAWLRNYGFGSPAALPDGRVACLSSYGLVVSVGGPSPPRSVPAAMDLADISPLPDGRLLCTTAGGRSLGVLDLRSGDVVRLLSTDTSDVHSVVYLGPRPRPPRVGLAGTDGPAREGERPATGYLLCQNVYNTRQTAADWPRVRAVRVYEGRPLALRSARHSYDHIGVQAVELGTVPLAPDGSFYAEVPADRALAIQAVDAEGRSVVNELSWIYVRPGEQRSCVGCHSPRQTAPAIPQGVLAVQAPPARLLGQGRPHRFRGNNAANGGVLNLQLDRFREVAAIDLYPNDRPTEVRALTALLADGEAAEKISAARRLAIFRDRSGAVALAKALGDDDAEVRMNAALALSACGDRGSAAALLAALDDAAPAVAQAAGMALENLTGHAEPFNAYAQAAPRPGAAAWRAWMKAHDWPAIEKPLIARLGQADVISRHQAIVALGHVAGSAGRAALRQWLQNDSGGDLRASLEALRALGHLRDAEAVPLLRATLDAAIEAAKGKHKGFHELGWWQRPAYLAATAAEALGWIAGSDAEAALIDAYARLGDFWRYTLQTGDHDWLMGSHSSVVHFRMAEALDAMGSRAVGPLAPALLRAVPIDTDRGLLLENDAFESLTGRLIRRAGLEAKVLAACLAVLGDAEAAAGEADLKAAVTASPPAVSVGPLCPESRAAQILSVVCDDAGWAARVRAAFDRYRAQPPSRKRSWVCFFLARALGRLGDAGSVGSLSAALTADATEASFGRPDPPNVYLHNAMTPCYRAAAADALGRIGDKRAFEALLATVANLDNAMDVRHAAAGALARIADPARLDALRAIARDYPELATRRELLRACAATQASGTVGGTLKRLRLRVDPAPVR